MRLTEHFDLEEFEQSDTADRLRIRNVVPTDLLSVAVDTAKFMEGIRMCLSRLEHKDIRIDVTSGYRCMDLNRALKSKDTSDHIKMLAIDFRAPDFSTPAEICRALEPMMGALGITQLIYEHTWVHVGRMTQYDPADRVLTSTVDGYTPGVQT